MNDIDVRLDQILKLKLKVSGLTLTLMVIFGVIWINSDEESLIYLMTSILLLLGMISLVVISLVFSIIINKMKTLHSIEYVKSIFKSSDEYEGQYIFPITDEELNVEFSKDGLKIQNQTYSYSDYEISLSAIALSRVIYLSLEMTRKDLNENESQVNIEQSFYVEFTHRVYQAIHEFELTIEDDSMRKLELLKNKTEETVKKILNRGYLSI
jgi:hypothetical protein